MNKNIWALYIGHLIISMNEIDWMTDIIQKKVLNKDISKTWRKKPLAERLNNLINSLSKDDYLHNILIELLREALALCEKRNLVAHGSFALDCREPMVAGEQSKFILHSSKHAEPATQNDVEASTATAKKLSDDISECIAAIDFRGSRA